MKARRRESPNPLDRRDLLRQSEVVGRQSIFTHRDEVPDTPAACNGTQSFAELLASLSTTLRTLLAFHCSLGCLRIATCSKDAQKYGGCPSLSRDPMVTLPAHFLHSWPLGTATPICRLNHFIFPQGLGESRTVRFVNRNFILAG